MHIKKKSPEKEEVCEIFEKEEAGETKEISCCGVQEIPEKVPGEDEKENKLLRNILIGVGVVFLLFIIFILLNNNIGNFEYEGVDFKTIREGNLLFYNTKLEMMKNGEHVADYNFFLRKDPRRLAEVPFYGKVAVAKNIVINSSGEFNCDGDGIIAIANLDKLFNVLGFKTLQDKNATCSQSANYSFIQIEAGNETKIVQDGVSCYTVFVKDCEILDATERFMLEIFVQVNSKD